MGRTDLINAIKHAMETLDSAKALLDDREIAEVMISDVIRELEAIVEEEV